VARAKAEVRKALEGRYIVVRYAVPFTAADHGSPDPDRYTWFEDEHFCVSFRRVVLVHDELQVQFYANPGGFRACAVKQIIRTQRTATRGAT
jgi:hypothetical protein